MTLPALGLAALGALVALAAAGAVLAGARGDGVTAGFVGGLLLLAAGTALGANDDSGGADV
jgi:hypothetical protein